MVVLSTLSGSSNFFLCNGGHAGLCSTQSEKRGFQKMSTKCQQLVYGFESSGSRRVFRACVGDSDLVGSPAKKQHNGKTKVDQCSVNEERERNEPVGVLKSGTASSSSAVIED